jgi:gliding motility-associated-like protein
LDNIAPVFITAIPSDIAVECDAIPIAALLSATDNCGTSNVTFLETRVDGTCISNYTLTRLWTATDSCGNFATATQTITVSDTNAPTIVGDFDEVINVNCDEIPTAPLLQFTDNCSGVGAITLPSNEVTIINQTPSSYTIIREWTVSDLCGNSNIFTQTINVTIQDFLIQTSHETCNGDLSTINLNDLIPVNYQGLGTWIDVNSSGGLHGNNDGIFSPFGIPIGSYMLEYQIDNPACPRKMQVTISISNDCIVLDCGNIIVHNAFSPNGDGLNEVFTIENIDDLICYPSNRIEIYNRWGILVYEADGYDNNSKAFRGISDGRATVNQSDELPTGTYFYLLQYISDGKTYKKDGYLYLSR